MNKTRLKQGESKLSVNKQVRMKMLWNHIYSHFFLPGMKSKRALLTDEN